MSQVQAPGSGDVAALTAGTGVKIPFDGTAGCLLANGVNYYFPIGDGDSLLKHVSLVWDAAIVVTFTIESTSIPMKKGNLDDAYDLSSFDNAAGTGWNRENPTSGVYISTTATDGTTGGATITGATIAIAGGTAGCASLHIGNLGSRRARIKAAVGGTGGKARCVQHGKY